MFAKYPITFAFDYGLKGEKSKRREIDRIYLNLIYSINNV